FKFFSGFPLSDTISIKGFYGLETYDLTKDLSTGSAGGDVAVKILDEVRHGLSLYASAGYRREFQPSGTDVATGSVTFGKSVKGFNLLGVFYLEKPFSKERDSVDVITSAAASYSFTNWLRWGVEYVGEDLEDIWEAEEAEGGARHLAATVVNLSPDGWTTQFTMGWGIGLTAGSAASVGRFLMLINF
ncbi:MAG: hypothetical protein FJ088_16140, partial [Deltaproteobacteria bacterium]|nr:hypothetical protein [Deltaproteobacteria bacterium]